MGYHSHRIKDSKDREMINANQAREQTLQLIEADDRKQITYISEEIQKAITKK